MEFICAFCKKNFVYEEQVDIDWETRWENHVCAECYITLLQVLKEGQCDEFVRHRALKISEMNSSY